MMIKKFSVDERLLDSEPMQRCTLGNCKAACCLYGVWVDLSKYKEIMSNAVHIKGHMKQQYQNPETWFEDHTEIDPHCPSGKVVHSAVVQDNSHYGSTACIFLRADHLCALQVASEANGFHPWHFKPFYCILHPLDLTDDGKITLDKNEDLLNEPASCLRPARDKIPLVETFQGELKFLLGQIEYKALMQRWEKKNK